jgi:hypothetical protein
VYAVQVQAYAKKDDAGAASYRVGINSNSNVENGPDVSPGTGYAATFAIWDLDPDGDVAWDEAAVNALKVRVENRT